LCHEGPASSVTRPTVRGLESVDLVTLDTKATRLMGMLMRPILRRGVWIAAIALLVIAGLITTQRVHSFGIEGPGFGVWGLVPWAVLAALPLLLLAAGLRGRLPQVSTAIAIASTLILAVSLALDLTGLAWMMDLLG
jgi:hypothetical protein